MVLKNWFPSSPLKKKYVKNLFSFTLSIRSAAARSYPAHLVGRVSVGEVLSSSELLKQLRAETLRFGAVDGFRRNAA